jgi:hypothetical protein
VHHYERSSWSPGNDLKRRVLDEIKSDSGLGLTAVFHLLAIIKLPGVKIIEVGGTHDIDDWEQWTQCHQCQGSNEEDILLVPLLRRAHWYLLHLDRRKRVILVYNPDRRVTDYQLRDICKAIIDKYTGTSSQTWKEPTDIKVPSCVCVSR